jgi:hypothetical protein
MRILQIIKLLLGNVGRIFFSSDPDGAETVRIKKDPTTSDQEEIVINTLPDPKKLVGKSKLKPLSDPEPWDQEIISPAG